MSPKKANSPPDYSSDIWSDVTPIPLDEGPGRGPALASIAYTARYSTAMSYLRAVMAANEHSDRSLALTADIISMNPAHYTVWLYRAKIIQELGKDVLDELRWLEDVALKSLKNYQIWHHRQILISTLANCPSTESAFLSHILSLDSKNYHVWTYRQWLVSHFDRFDSRDEWKAVKALLESDVRNNSAWNHRWFLCFGREERQQQQRRRRRKNSERSKATSEADDESRCTSTPTQRAVITDEDLIDRESRYAQGAILLAPQNQSPWTYLRALYRRSGRPLSDLGPFAEQFMGPDGNLEEGVRSSHALDLLAEIYGEKGARQGDDGEELGKQECEGEGEGEGESEGKGESKGESEGKGESKGENKDGNDVEMAKKLLRALGDKWDPIRKGYWDYRIRSLD